MPEPTMPILLDIALPDSGGTATLDRLRTLRPDAPIIMATANADEALACETLTRGAFDYIMKPFDFERLGRVLEGGRRQPAALAFPSSSSSERPKCSVASRRTRSLSMNLSGPYIAIRPFRMFSYTKGEAISLPTMFPGGRIEHVDVQVLGEARLRTSALRGRKTGGPRRD
jgi:DNA-binding response OmpR family regulator